jgi:hypothetical protein
MVKSSLSGSGPGGSEKQHFAAVSAHKYALGTNLMAELSRI